MPADAQEYRQELITKAVPWIVSVMLHASIALILAFIVMLTVAEDPKEHRIALGVYDIPDPPFVVPKAPDNASYKRRRGAPEARPQERDPPGSVGAAQGRGGGGAACAARPTCT